MEGQPRPGNPLISVVCPVFNEEQSIMPFYERLCSALKDVDADIRFEFLFVNNRSVDATLEVLRQLQETDPRVQILTMSRNFGYQASITAGMRHAKGDAIVNIDVDCEDPPELIPMFIERWLWGVDVAYGLRHQREEFVGMHLARKLFYRLTRRIADHEIVLDMAEFLLMDRRVRDIALSTGSTFPFVRGQVAYVGFRREGIPYRRQRRLVGKTHYSVLGAIKFGVSGILASSTFPLRGLMYAGVVAFALDVAATAWVLFGGAGPGMSILQRLFAALLIMQAAWLMLALGILGVYLARVYKDTIGLPLYALDERESSYGNVIGDDYRLHIRHEREPGYHEVAGAKSP
jgi:dolichol-phosphate mannosyltransferase